MYYNVISGIKSYQNIFGILDSNESEGIPIASFTGMSANSENELENLWNMFKDPWPNNTAELLNENLSLTYEGLNKSRKRLLNEGFQTKFKWGLYNGGLSEEAHKNVIYMISKKGLEVLELQDPPGPVLPSIGFSLNFIDINFEINNNDLITKNTTIIKRVNI
ncbi:hypothetical protein [Spiroplasma taiwanense]|uniref:Uncharacterized protein n=1 Tax=Spiroplasma taiwanense CT-1 TaxID=1276220 RepID=S5LTM6_9MOLU|nr:hypothetical protein [Spiroplasma taiwanense]AGR41064.1 hypothetical protein STAIW_v1c04140 [Spiroplasma taiwanense CT-1]